MQPQHYSACFRLLKRSNSYSCNNVHRYLNFTSHIFHGRSISGTSYMFLPRSTQNGKQNTNSPYQLKSYQERQPEKQVFIISHGLQQARFISTSASRLSADKEKQTLETRGGQSNDSEKEGQTAVSAKDKLKKAVKEYGSIVIVFHVFISLISLGIFYVLVSSGLDVVWLLSKMGVSEAFLQSKIASGASTFVIAYAVHKCFAGVRIGITLTCTPMIVWRLRKLGFLKPPK